MYERRGYPRDLETRDQGQPERSRQERLMEARAAFENDFHTAGNGPSFWRRPNDREPFPEEDEMQTEGMPFRFGLMRFMASCMLLLILLAAFASDFSYHGFNQDYVQERLNDGSAWDRLEKKVQSICVAALEQYQERSGK